ncbi:MAG: ATP synthase F0 subunit B [Oscillospiraceae bacterium]|nr:ATP synthase F0 subunit B [Oscillospiraceae bacterium]
MNPMLSILAVLPEGRVFGLDGQTLIQIGAMLLNVSVLAYILYRLLYKPVRGFMARRADRIRTELSVIEDEKGRIKALELQYDNMLGKVQQERYEILEAARKQAVENKNQVLAEAKREADAIRSRARTQAEMEMESARDEVRSAIIEAASLMSEKFITAAMDKETSDRLFAQTMQELGEAVFVSAGSAKK